MLIKADSSCRCVRPFVLVTPLLTGNNLNSCPSIWSTPKANPCILSESGGERNDCRSLFICDNLTYWMCLIYFSLLCESLVNVGGWWSVGGLSALQNISKMMHIFKIPTKKILLYAALIHCYVIHSFLLLNSWTCSTYAHYKTRRRNRRRRGPLLVAFATKKSEKKISVCNSLTTTTSRTWK